DSTTDRVCSCASLPDLAVVPMGGDGLDERVFATLENVANHGGELWWLYLSGCTACGQNWLVAQEERIFDEYLLRRQSVAEARQIISEQRWPDEFNTYERVLKLVRALSQSHVVFADALSLSLVSTAHDLRKERANITVEEIAYL